MPDIQHPDQPPAWLSSWPPENELAAKFHPNVRSFANGMMLREKRLSLSWEEKLLSARIGEQYCTWRLLNGTWKIRCSCGYPKPECVHAYMAHLMLRDVCRKEHWQMPGGNVQPQPPQRPAPPQRPVAQPQPPQRPATPAGITNTRTAAPTHPHMRQGDFFSSLDLKPCKKEAAIEVEADFKASKFFTGIRFYVHTKDRRDLMILCRIRNMAVEILADSPTRPSQWKVSDADKEFLNWVMPYLRRIPLSSMSMNMLHVQNDDFKTWLERWGNVPGRIIDRDSRQDINCKQISTPEKLQFHLYPHGATVHVGAVFTMKDGKSFHCHQLLEQIRNDPTRFLVRDTIMKFNSPLPWEILIKNFANCTLELPGNEVCSTLPRLLLNHLELIAEGPIVEIHRGGEAKLSAQARLNNRGDFVISLQEDGGAGLNDQGNFSGIRRSGGKFIVTLHSPGHIQEVLQLFQNNSVFKKSGNDFTLPGTAEGAGHLVKLWNALPKDVIRKSTRDVYGLLNQNKKAPLSFELNAREIGNLVEISADCTVDGRRFNPADLNSAIRTSNPYVKTPGGEWFAISREEAAEAMEALANAGIDTKPSLMLPDTAKSAIQSLKKNQIFTKAAPAAPVWKRVEEEEIPPAPPVPGTLAHILRPYQRLGVDFLAERARYSVGAVLADDMGLGKTLQILTLLESARANRGTLKALVVTPASVADVWRQQASVFCPALKVSVMRGTKPQRQNILTSGKWQMLVAHYGLVRMDAAALADIDFDFVILDEAQAIKNPDAQVSCAVRSLNAKCRLALTGTPLENRLLDLWSIMDFLNPGLWGGREDFEYSAATSGGRSRLLRRLSLLMLRRTKNMVAPELPPRTEELVSVQMPDEVRKLYVKTMTAAKAESSGSMTGLLAAITKMRRFCCAPELVDDALAEDFPNPKLDFLMDKLEELAEGGHSVLVFSQFTSMLDIIRTQLEKRKLKSFSITGETPVEKRSAIVKDFNDEPQPSVFLLSLKAAGTGLTLTKADYVFLYDPWWNPAAENQAIDRTHRIGQDKPVFAYRIVLKDSLEEKVLAIVEEKRRLFQEVIDGADTGGNSARLTMEELKGLLG